VPAGAPARELLADGGDGAGLPRIYANADNATGGGILIADDGGFFDFNDGWINFRGSTGLRITSDNTGLFMLADMLNTSGAGLGDRQFITSNTGWGYIGSSTNAWYRMYSYAYNTVSDERLKTDIVDLDETAMRGMLDRLDEIRSVTFRYNIEAEHPEKGRDLPHIGVIAQSMPPEVIETDGEVMTINIMDTLGLTIAAVRGLRAETRESAEDLQAQIDQCNARLDALESRLDGK